MTIQITRKGAGAHTEELTGVTSFSVNDGIAFVTIAGVVHAYNTKHFIVSGEA